MTVVNAGCLEGCKLGPVMFDSGDRTWCDEVTPEVAKQIVEAHLVKGEKVRHYLYPPVT